MLKANRIRAAAYIPFHEAIARAQKETALEQEGSLKDRSPPPPVDSSFWGPERSRQVLRLDPHLHQQDFPSLPATRVGGLIRPIPQKRRLKTSNPPPQSEEGKNPVDQTSAPSTQSCTDNTLVERISQLVIDKISVQISAEIDKRILEERKRWEGQVAAVALRDAPKPGEKPSGPAEMVESCLSLMIGARQNRDASDLVTGLFSFFNSIVDSDKQIDENLLPEKRAKRILGLGCLTGVLDLDDNHLSKLKEIFPV
jgi:hypothetical protein